jgi:hypothetical protein
MEELKKERGRELELKTQGGAGIRLQDFSPRHSSSTPGGLHTCFYNHAHRLRLEKLLYLGFSRGSNGFLKPLLDPGGGFRSETAVT